MCMRWHVLHDAPLLRLLDIAARQHAVVHRRDAKRAGVDRKRYDRLLVDGPLLRESAHVARVRGAPQTMEQRTTLAVLDTPGRAGGARKTAAWFHGLLTFAPPREIQVLTEHTKDHPTELGRVHRSRRVPAHHFTRIRGVRVTTVERTLFDLAMEIHPRRLERILDNALERRLTNVRKLQRMLSELDAPGRKGIGVMRRLIAARVAADYRPTESELEELFLALLRDHGIVLPRRQVDLGDVERWIGHVDFVWSELGVVVEVCGRLGHESLTSRIDDDLREEALKKAGFKEVLWFDYDDITRRPRQVARTVRATLAEVAGDRRAA